MTTQTSTITVTSSAFKQGEPVPKKYSGEGQNISPPLSWSGVPDSAAELVLICEDPDAPRGIFTHWVLCNMSPQTTSLPEGVKPVAEPPVPAGGVQGRNGGEKLGYTGPLPPPGHGVHHYHFRLFALDRALKLRSGLTREQVMIAIHGHVICEGEIVGTYERR